MNAKTGLPPVGSLSEYHSAVEVGSGSYSRVYRGICRVSGAVVALKVVNAAPRLLSESCQESAIMKCAEHPNLCSLLRTFTDDKSHRTVLVLEYCVGGDLANLIRKRTRLPERQALEIFRQVCQGLSHLRSRHIIHRDLKPANVLLTDKSSTPGVRVTDFGLASVLTSAAALASTQCGSPYYSSPELLAGEEYGHPSDVWSVGVVLYEMVYGVLPYRGSTPNQVLRNIKAAKWLPAPGVFATHDLLGILETCLSVDPTLRPTPKDLCARLDLMLSNSSIAQHAGSSPECPSPILHNYRRTASGDSVRIAPPSNVNVTSQRQRSLSTNSFSSSFSSSSSSSISTLSSSLVDSSGLGGFLLRGVSDLFGPSRGGGGKDKGTRSPVYQNSQSQQQCSSSSSTTKGSVTDEYVVVERPESKSNLLLQEAATLSPPQFRADFRQLMSKTIDSTKKYWESGAGGPIAPTLLLSNCCDTTELLLQGVAQPEGDGLLHQQLLEMYASMLQAATTQLPPNLSSAFVAIGDAVRIELEGCCSAGPPRPAAQSFQTARELLRELLLEIK